MSYEPTLTQASTSRDVGARNHWPICRRYGGLPRSAPMDVRHDQAGYVVQPQASSGCRLAKGLRPVQAELSGVLIDVGDPRGEVLTVEQVDLHGNAGLLGKSEGR